MLFCGSSERPAFRRSHSRLDPLGLALAGDAGRRLPSTFILPDLIAPRIARRARARNYVDKADRCPDFCWLGGPCTATYVATTDYRLSGHRETRSILRLDWPIGYSRSNRLSLFVNNANSTPAEGIGDLRISTASSLIFHPFRWDRAGSILGSRHTRCIHS